MQRAVNRPGSPGSRASPAVVEIPLVSFAIAPAATRARLDQLNRWMSTHQRLVITTLAGIVGVYLILIGVSKLSSARDERAAATRRGIVRAGK
jgi:Sap, sulfolipid-1-addressing protein